jgi:putative hydrolase of HD superfamily
MKDDLNKIISLSYKFTAIDRDMFYPNSDRPENDAEHTFQLALVAWHIIEKDNLPLNKEKVFKICLAHDLVEVYSGDVPLWGKEGHDEKIEKEKLAIEKLKEEFSENKELIEAILEYKEKEIEEGKFVNALDKLLPFMNQLNTEGKVWKNHNVTLEQVMEKLEKHSKISTHLTKYFDEGFVFLNENRDKYFKL